jgi:putative membrane protein
MMKLLIGACLVAAPTLATAATVSGPDYIKKAGASDLYEIESSKLVLATKNAKLHSFASEMIKDHTQSTADVKAAAAAAHLKAGPPMLDATGAANIAKLKRVNGAARDSLYIAQQKQSHQMALTLQQGYATSGGVAPLRAAATKIVPVVKHHIGELSAM